MSATLADPTASLSNRWLDQAKPMHSGTQSQSAIVSFDRRRPIHDHSKPAAPALRIAGPAHDRQA